MSREVKVLKGPASTAEQLANGLDAGWNAHSPQSHRSITEAVPNLIRGRVIDRVDDDLLHEAGCEGMLLG